jgi:hypothetical protein
MTGTASSTPIRVAVENSDEQRDGFGRADVRDDVEGVLAREREPRHGRERLDGGERRVAHRGEALLGLEPRSRVVAGKHLHHRIGVGERIRAREQQ